MSKIMYMDEEYVGSPTGVIAADISATDSSGSPSNVQDELDAREVIDTDSTTATTDNAGRILLYIPPEKLLSVSVRSTSYWCVPRYHSNGTLVYIYSIGTFNTVNSTSVTLDYSYIT